MKMILLAGLLLSAVSCAAAKETIPDGQMGAGLTARNSAVRTVIHAGGILWGRDDDGGYASFAGTNAREGLVQCADAGQNTVELDFCFTSDDVLVCIHDWESGRTGGNGAPMPLEQFVQSEIDGNFTPLTLDDAADFLREHTEMTIVTDIKERFGEAAARIADACSGCLDRVVIQIYAKEQYDTACALGFERIAYTLYALPWSEKTDTEAHIAFAQTHPLEWIAFDAALCEPDFVGEMRRSGVPLYVHTVNDGHLREALADMGIDGFYTDIPTRRCGR